MHNGHKIVEISNEESLKKENITLEYSAKEFNDLVQKINNLKENIENEIDKINNLYEKAVDELDKSFQKKHEKLIKEENDIKEKLQNAVTKVKENLEYYLSQTNNEIKLNEKIIRGIKKIETEEKNMFRNLSYITKINKNKKSMNKLSQEIIKGLNFFYKEDENNIEYEEDYVNGMPNIIDNDNIKINDITYNSANISWNIDINNFPFIKNKINEVKYKFEMRIENKDFVEVYNGVNNNCFIDNLSQNSNYEFKICSMYKENISPWTEIQKFKTNNFDSIILKDLPKNNEYIKKLLEWTKSKKMELIYRATRDGTTTQKFHEFCDNKGSTIILFKNEKGNAFGGYASIPWSNSGGWKSAPDSFIFTLTNIHNTEPTQFLSKNDNQELYFGISHGPFFGGGRDIGICGDFSQKDFYSKFPFTYLDNLGKGKSIFTGDFNNDIQNFKIKEIEAFKIYK